MSAPAETPTHPTVDRELLQQRIEQVCRVMSAHAGGIELLDVSSNGAVRLRFNGMCTGCLFRPLTMQGTIEPALLEVPGVTTVEAAGARLSHEATTRMHHYLKNSKPPLPPLQQ